MSVRAKLRAFACNVLDWHAPTENNIDAAWHGTPCRHCNRPVLQDSQGNWFSIGERRAGE